MIRKDKNKVETKSSNKEQRKNKVQIRTRVQKQKGGVRNDRPRRGNHEHGGQVEVSEEGRGQVS